MQQVNILWSGGLDSSFRMLQLSKYSVSIQPYYFRDNRKSVQYELNAIAEITQDILAHPETKCRIMPLIIMNSEEVKPDNKIAAAYRRLRQQTNIGSQYDWLARFAKSVPNLELCIEKAKSSKALACITRYGSLKKSTEGELAFYVIDKEKSSEDLVIVFGNFRFPTIDITKQEMIFLCEKMKFDRTLHKTWFCFSPIKGKPCGMCNPCMSAIQEGMGFRFTKSGLIRNKIVRITGHASLLSRLMRYF